MDNLINENLQKIRGLMQQGGIDTYIITKNDPHQSEGGKPHWNSVKFISGFTGSAGNVVITKDKAVLFTDGRYSIQAEKELSGTDFTLNVITDPGAKGFLEIAVDETPAGGVIGFDERTISCMSSASMLVSAKRKNIQFKTDIDLVGELWTDRPLPSDRKLFEHEIQYTGLSRVQKINLLKESIKGFNASHYILSALDDIAWLFNLRCADLNNSLVFESYAVIGEETLLFLNPVQAQDVKDSLEKDGIRLMPYDGIKDYLRTLPKSDTTKVLYAPEKTSYSLYNTINALGVSTVEIGIDITARMKAVKNNTELENTRKAHIRDGAAVARFIKWIKTAAKTEHLTEVTAGQKLDSLRAADENFICYSFGTICGYGSNAALTHYRAKEEDCLAIEPHGFLLVDSGGNYKDGTTDITRTISLGGLTDEMKRDYTLVLKCHIALAKTIFLYGATGSNLDVIARMPLWEQCKDFKHGTGHGIGFFLNCHEGPHRISMAQNPIALEEGMMVSNEPGFYIKDRYGIRSENIIVAREHSVNEYGRFMCFETITFCPFDLEAVDPALLTESEIKWLNDYHKAVYEKLSPLMDEEERAWLKNETRAI